MVVDVVVIGASVVGMVVEGSSVLSVVVVVPLKVVVTGKVLVGTSLPTNVHFAPIFSDTPLTSLVHGNTSHPSRP